MAEHNVSKLHIVNMACAVRMFGSMMKLAFKLQRTLLHSQTFLLVTVLEWSLFSMADYLMAPVSTVPFRLSHQMVQH